MGTVLLVPNRRCAADGHAMCWRVECRHCKDCLAAHVDARDLRMETVRLFQDHTCAVDSHTHPPTRSAAVTP